jgi:ATP-binding cassette, subfamily C, bacterial LapB
MTLLAVESEARAQLPPPCDWRPLIEPLLEALRWKGADRHLRETLAYHSDRLDLDAFRNVMVHLGYASHKRRDSPARLTEGLLPAIYIDARGVPRLVRFVDDVTSLPKGNATILLFTQAAAPAAQAASAANLRKQLGRFRPVLSQAALFSLLIGLVALAPAFLNMAVYDHIISSGSSRALFMFSVGAGLALAAELLMRHLRNKRLSWMGARIDHYVSCSVFERLMYLPPHYTERASVSSQLARLRDFEAVREFFTGPLASLLFELPLVAVYLVVMAIMGGWLALVPLGLLFAYALLIWFMDPKLKQYGQIANAASTKRQEFLLETVTRLRAIRLAGLEDVWLRRGRQISAEASYATFRATFGAQMLETASFVLMTLGILATLAFGVYMVVKGTLTTGGLIAAVMMMWRIMAPLQVCCASISRIQQLAASTRQVQHLLSVPPEHSPYGAPALIGTIHGHVAFHRVWLRYAPDTEPALLGLTFEAQPGQVLSIRGSNGSGKSTLLKVLLGMYPPQSGSVRLDGVDIRQLDPLSLRQEIAYAPQFVDFFPGSVRDNLLFCHPVATEKDCLQALEEACALEEVMRLPDRMDTIIAGANVGPIPFLLRQRLNLARAYVKPARIVLFDEGSYSLGQENDVAFARKIAQLRGRATVLMVTHREDHMRLADRMLALDKGEATHNGPPDQVLSALARKR